jgi:hypothetical protein
MDPLLGGLMFHRKPHYSAEELLALYWKLKGAEHSADVEEPMTDAREEGCVTAAGVHDTSSRSGSKRIAKR